MHDPPSRESCVQSLGVVGGLCLKSSLETESLIHFCVNCFLNETAGHFRSEKVDTAMGRALTYRATSPKHTRPTAFRLGSEDAHSNGAYSLEGFSVIRRL